MWECVSDRFFPLALADLLLRPVLAAPPQFMKTVRCGRPLDTRLLNLPSTVAYGVEERPIRGAVVRVFNPAKTVADCFKFRNKIGLDVALEALRDCIRQRKATRDEIWRAAQVCRVANVMRPYMESLE